MEQQPCNTHHESKQRESAWRQRCWPAWRQARAGALGAVLQAEIGSGAMPTLTTSSPSAKGAVRRWTQVEDFTQEVANARIYEGVHYRISTEVGTAMGKQIGELAATKVLQASH